MTVPGVVSVRFSGVMSFDSDGEALSFMPDKEKGVYGATIGCLTFPKGSLNLFATILGVFRIFSESGWLAPLGDGFKTSAGFVAAVPGSILELSKGVEGLVAGKYKDFKTWASTFKGVGDGVGIGALLHKVKVVEMSASLLYYVNAVKTTLVLIGDLFTLGEVWTKKQVDRSRLPTKVLMEGERGIFAKESTVVKVKAVVATVFHAILGASVLFAIPLAPTFISILGAIFTAAVLWHHYVQSAREDVEARMAYRVCVNLKIGGS